MKKSFFAFQLYEKDRQMENNNACNAIIDGSTFAGLWRVGKLLESTYACITLFMVHVAVHTTTVVLSVCGLRCKMGHYF